MSSIFGFGVGMLVLIVPLLVIAAIVAAIVKRSKDPEEKNGFEKNIRTIYVYLVAIIFLFALVYSVIDMFNNTLDFLFPEKEITYYANTPTIDMQQNNARNSNLVNLWTSIATFVISAPLFIYHSKLAKEI